jgi:hypothetical protein
VYVLRSPVRTVPAFLDPAQGGVVGRTRRVLARLRSITGDVAQRSFDEALGAAEVPGFAHRAAVGAAPSAPADYGAKLPAASQAQSRNEAALRRVATRMEALRAGIVTCRPRRPGLGRLYADRLPVR